MKNQITKKSLRVETSKQFSGGVNIGKIKKLKEKNYFIKDIPLDGDQPKQYIKAYFYYKNCPRKLKLKYWNGYFAKFGGKSYPIESVIEFTINKIGEYLSLKMNETEIVVSNTQIRFLSKDFLGKGQILVHGIEIIAEYLEDKDFVDNLNQNRTLRREMLTFNDVEKAIIHVFPEDKKEILEELIKLITFDAIVGNNDRHFYNWGVIKNVKKKDIKVVFSPIYDSARALCWNKTEENIVRMTEQINKGSNELDYFILKSKPRFSFEDNPGANHFELISYLLSNKPDYIPIIKQLICKESEDNVLNRLRIEVFPLLSESRTKIINLILKERFSKLRESI